MEAKCIKADPLGWLTVGAIYQIGAIGHIHSEAGRTYRVSGTGFAVNEENFNEMFEIIKN